MTVYLIEEFEKKYVANSSGVINLAKNHFDIEVEDIDDIDKAISELEDGGVYVSELDFDTQPLIEI